MPESGGYYYLYDDKEKFNPLSELDLVWSGASDKSEKDSRFSNYYDYYFSGEDIKVYIDGLFNAEDELDIASFAYAVKQEKQPLYGFWSYNFDTMLYGTRIITGEFTIFTKYPRRMTDLIEKATNQRVNNPTPQESMNGVVSPLRSNTNNADDEKNLKKYWAYSQLDRITQDPFVKATSGKNGHSIFSAHPPFNIVILYGTQEASLSAKDYSGNSGKELNDNLDRMMVSDINERLIKPNDNMGPMKVILQEVHLSGMTTAYNPGGQPVAESYQFIARDTYFSEVNLGFIKSQIVDSASVTDQGKNGQSQTETSTTNINP